MYLIFPIPQAENRQRNKQQTGKRVTCEAFNNRIYGCMGCGPCYQRSYNSMGRGKLWWLSWK